ncbi:MAG: tetratricopeptide repeat protein, partial [Acidobacteriia bacterium]|nr:tetratricopeptide repeat protein [Terriglobia bacterium]
LQGGGHFAHGDQRGIARALNNLAGAAHDQGDYPAVLAMFEESLAIFRKLDDLGGIAMLLNNLGDLASSQSDYAGARALYIEGLTIRSELGDRWGIAETLNGLAYVAFGLASFGQATRMWGGAERLREEIGATLQPRDRLRYDRQVAAARAAMGDNAFDLTWQDGRAMTLEQAIRFALGKV